MNRNAKNKPRWVLTTLVTLAAGLSLAHSREKPKPPEFQYAGGTETLHKGCEGPLEVTSVSLTFKCSSGSVSIPYSTITLMQYRSDISRQVRMLKLDWKTKPRSGGSTRNHYFTIVFTGDGATRAIVLAVPPEMMRPYLAEIDLKAGQRVEVQSHEGYD